MVSELKHLGRGVAGLDPSGSFSHDVTVLCFPV
jgi:hypothetical protein